MTDNVTKFCDIVQGKLDSLDGRMAALKLNIGTTWHSLQEKLGEVRRKGAASQQSLIEARAKLQQWIDDSKTETKSTIDQWVANCDTQQLATRAQKAEECAWTSIMIAQASIDDAERMILEAISAKLDAEAVAHH
jgi:ElaB/YqjD/DUF883 family membrane-anchored ribosome-binding protein